MVKLQDLFTAHLESSTAFSGSTPYQLRGFLCVDFHNVMLIYVQTIANNFSHAISSLRYI